MELIAQHSNPFFLKELYLDGCEHVNDMALIKLTKPRTRPIKLPNKDNYRYNTLLNQDQIAQIAGSDEEYHKMMTEISNCGTRALEVISLSECRQISDNGISKLAKCKLLRKVCFLGCGNLKDQGVVSLCQNLIYLEELDVGSTNITG